MLLALGSGLLEHGYEDIYDFDNALVRNFIFDLFIYTTVMLLRFNGYFWFWNMCSYYDRHYCGPYCIFMCFFLAFYL